MNQCSWAAASFCRRAHELTGLYGTGAARITEEFVALYSELLLEASHLRKKCNKFHCGENVNDEELLQAFPAVAESLGPWRSHETNPNNRADTCEMLKFMENGAEWVSVFYCSSQSTTPSSTEQLAADIKHAAEQPRPLRTRVAHRAVVLLAGHG